MWEHLHTSAHRSSAAICGRDEKSEVYYNRGLTPVNPGRKWDKAKENGVWLKLFYSTPVSALSSRCEWHGLASCWNVNRHATHTPITPNNLLHCYLHFNSQLSVRSYSVAPHNPCVLFSLLWQARVRFHLLPLLACDRVVKNLPEAGGIKAYWNVYDLQISLSRHQVYFLLNSLLQLLISRAALNLRAQKDTDFQRTGNLVNCQNVLCILHNSLENLFLIG